MVVAHTRDVYSRAMTADSPKLDLDRQLLDIYLTGLQSEVEAKLRQVARFRAEMRKIDAAGGTTDRVSLQRTAAGLIAQVDEMLKTNLLVRQTLQDIRLTAEELLKDSAQ
jgi:hypothetical protein